MTSSKEINRILHKIALKHKISFELVESCHKNHLNTVKDLLDNPSFDVLEIPNFCSFQIRDGKLKYAIRSRLKSLRKYNKLYKEKPTIDVLKKLDNAKNNFRTLWKLKQILHHEAVKKQNRGILTTGHQRSFKL